MTQNLFAPALTPGTLLRVDQFIPTIIPMCKAKWWDGVKKGIYPKPVKLGPRVTAWKSDDLLALIEKGV
jgi:predicted DNA-binding transcriptional regulator AlpA